jgi:hypothetical protein
MQPADIIINLEIAGGVVAYAIIEYYRRELRHREAMEYLRRDLMPPAPSLRPRVWTLATTGLICIVLALVTGGFVVLSAVAPNLRMMYGTIAFIFFMIFGLLVTIFMQDLHRYKAGEPGKGDMQ